MDKASMDMAWIKALLEDDGDAASMLIAAGSDPHEGICGGASPSERAREDGSRTILAAVELGMRSAGPLAGAAHEAGELQGGIDSVIGDLIARIESGAELPSGMQVMDLADMDPQMREAMGLPEGLAGAKIVRMGAPGQPMPEGLKAALDALASGQGSGQVLRMGQPSQIPEGLKALLDAIGQAVGQEDGQADGEGEWFELGDGEEEGPDLGHLIGMPVRRQLH